MTITAQWLQAVQYPASADRGVLSALTAKAGAGVSRDGAYGPSELAPSAPGLGMSIDIGPGSASVAGYIVTSDAPVTVTFDVGSGGTRTDLVVMRVYDQEAGDGSSEAAIEVIKGTSASEPALPTRAIRIAAVQISASAILIDAGMVVDRRQYTAASGGMLLFGTTGERDTAYAAAPFGLCVVGASVDAGTLYRRRAGGWHELADVDEIVGAPIVSGITWDMDAGWTMAGYTLCRVGPLASAFLSLTRSGAAIPIDANGNGSGTILNSWPAGWAPADASSQFVFAAAMVNRSPLVCTLGPTQMLFAGGSPSTTLASGASVRMAFTYRVAAS